MSMSIFGIFVFVVVIIVPAIVGALMIFYSRRRGLNYPSCGGCGYDVTGSVGTTTRCPECGKEFVAVGIIPPAGQRNPMMLWVGLGILLIPLTCLGFGLATSMVRMSQAQQAAVRAQQQAVAAQQAATAQAAASTQPAPPPLTDDQINTMDVAEAQAALKEVSIARHNARLSEEDKVRLKSEFDRLLTRINSLKRGS